MPDTAYEFLTKFFTEYLSFSPTPGQIATFQSDLSLVSPFLMEAALVEVAKGTQGYVLVYKPNEWRPAIFNVYNRKVAEHAQLFSVFHSFETAFRSTVAVTLEAYYDRVDWWGPNYLVLQNGKSHKDVEFIGKRSPIPVRTSFLIEKIIDTVEDRGKPVSAIKNGYEFLEYSTLSQIKRLVEEHWDVFAPLFSRKRPPLTRSAFSAKFDRVEDARNDVYHHKSVARMANVVSAAEELLDHLNFCLGFVFKKTQETKVSGPSFRITPAPRHRTW